MSFTEILQEVESLSPAERKQLLQRLEAMEFLADPQVANAIRQSDEQIRSGRIFARAEVIAAVEKAEREERAGACQTGTP